MKMTGVASLESVLIYFKSTPINKNMLWLLIGAASAKGRNSFSKVNEHYVYYCCQNPLIYGTLFVDSL